MKLTFTQMAMEKCLQRVVGAIAARVPMTVLNNILLRVDSGKLQVTATDLEITITSPVEMLECEGSGSVLIHAKRFQELIKQLPDVSLELVVDNQEKVVLKGQGVGVYTIPAGDPVDYPEIPVIEAKQSITLKAELMKRLLSKVLFAVSHDDMRPVLTGVLMQIRPGELRLIATDGHRLSRILTRDVQYSGEPRDVIVPMKALSMLQRNVADDEEITVGFAETRAQFLTESQLLLTRLIDGNYPRYENVIPEQNKDMLSAKTSDFMACVRRVSIFANQISKQVLLTVSPTEIKLDAEDQELGGKASEQMAGSFTGESLEVAYNWAYLSDCLRQVDTEEVVFQVSTSDDAAIVKPTSQNEDEDFFMLLMPIRLR